MPYRTPSKPGTRGELVTVRRYLDPVVAHADCAHLTAAGITAHVIEAASYNPLLANAVGGVQLQVGSSDVDRAEEILAAGAPGVSAELDDGEDPGAVRCPRCELAYCSFERPRLRGIAPGAAGGLALIVSAFLAMGKKRWCCHRCGHVWDDPKEGPAAITKLEPDDPRPIFRLRRGHAGMGLFVGLIAGFFAGTVLGGSMGTIVGLAVIGGAWLIGGMLRHDVCSEPQCRAPLPLGVEECPRCKGAVAGVILTAEAHYSAAADFRRDLAALHAQRSAPKLKKAKKAKPRLGPADA
jgi:hypothetical protein